jgi:hypothetical protein
MDVYQCTKEGRRMYLYMQLSDTAAFCIDGTGLLWELRLF